uniref:phage/plasmid primase, P4 family n=1 Tax=Methylobacterium sp. GC_Met_2 TaxID=2937376 RepID=UPI00226BAE28
MDRRDPFDEMEEALGPERHHPFYHDGGPTAAGPAPEVKAKRPRKRADDNGDLLTEDWAARQFAERHVGRLLFCHDTGKWYVWTGAAWAPNRSGIAFQWARELAREMSVREADKTRFIASKTSFAAGVERFARVDPAFAVTIEGWDADPWLLATPGGTVDLRSGELREAIPAQRVTKLAAVAPAEAPDCPKWLRFLDEVTQGDAGYIRFLRQWAGYCLTGDTSEQALCFAYGGGGNGKGVFIHVLAGILNDYALNAAMEVFTASKHDRHPTEIAALRGARLVTASETEQGRKWAEARIKQLTGGDVMRARFMRQDEFEFTPVLKLLIIGNNKPGLSSVDDAARRRFNLLPFLFKPAVPDPQ